MAEIVIREPNDKEFEQVKKHVEEFWLDNGNMVKSQFRILLFNNRLAAFGRLRENDDAIELCTLGVIKRYQKRGIGMAIVRALLSSVEKDVYIVTVIPKFFLKLGFDAVKQYPKSLQKKRDLCTTQYHVGEAYEVMKWSKNQTEDLSVEIEMNY